MPSEFLTKQVWVMANETLIPVAPTHIGNFDAQKCYVAIYSYCEKGKDVIESKIFFWEGKHSNQKYVKFKSTMLPVVTQKLIDEGSKTPQEVCTMEFSTLTPSDQTGAVQRI